MDIKEQLIKFESEYNILKNKIERLLTIYIIAFFLPPLVLIFLYKFYFKIEINLIVKIVIYSIVVIGIIVYYILRYKFFKDKKRYKKFFEERIKILKENFNNDDEFRNAVIENAKKIFKDNGIPFTFLNISISNFWKLLFINLEIDIEKL